MTRASIGSICTQTRQRCAAVLSWRPADRRWIWAALGLLLAVAGLTLALAPARAFDLANDVVVPAIGFIVETLVSFLGQILLLVVGVLINVAQYNSFVTSPVVGTGWVIVRDVVNMFFIVVLLVLAFGTILGVQTYSIKGGNLTRLLIMAIVINFSRTLCGLMIDFGQVVMLTFVSGFKDAAGGNFVEAMKINEVLQAATGGENVSTAGVVISLILALVMTAIATFVVIMMTVALLIRIVYLWLLVILSPIAFFLKAVPGGQASKAYADWWSKFTSNVIFGPVMAFFLWLSLVTVQQSNIGAGFKTDTTGESISDSVGAAFNGASIQTFMIAVCLLLGGYQISVELGGSTTGMASKARQGATGLAKRAAAQVSKRTGMDAYLASRRAAKEEKYQARGAAIQRGVGLAQVGLAKTAILPGRLAEKGVRGVGRGIVGGVRQVREKGVGGAVRAAAAGVAAGGGKAWGSTKEAVKAAGRATKERLTTAEGWKKTGAAAGAAVAAGYRGTKKVLASPATVLAESGRADYNRGRDHKYKKVQQEMASLANRKDSEVKDLADGKVAGAKPAEQQAAILKLMEKGFVATPADMKKYGDRLEQTGADPATRESYKRMAKEKFPGALEPEGPASEFDMNKAWKGGTIEAAKLEIPQMKDVFARQGSLAQDPKRRMEEEKLLQRPEAAQAKEAALAGVREFLAKKEPAGLKPDMTEGARAALMADFEQKQAAARGTLARLGGADGAKEAYGISNGQFINDAARANFESDMKRPGAQETLMSISASEIMQGDKVTDVGQALVQALDKMNNSALKAAPGVTDKTPEQESALKAVVQAVEKVGRPGQQEIIRGRNFAGLRSSSGEVDEEDEEVEKPKKKSRPAESSAPVASADEVAAAAASPKPPAAAASPKPPAAAASPIVDSRGRQQPPAAVQKATVDLEEVQNSLREFGNALKDARAGKTVVVQGQKLDTKAIEQRLEVLARKESEIKSAISEANKPKRPTPPA